MKTIQADQTLEFKTWLRGILQDVSTKNLCVTFTKKDGTERDLYCTLSENRIPFDKQAKESGSITRSFSDEAIRVFDTEKQEWRSFRWESVKHVRVDA